MLFCSLISVYYGLTANINFQFAKHNTLTCLNNNVTAANALAMNKGHCDAFTKYTRTIEEHIAVVQTDIPCIECIRYPDIIVTKIKVCK